MARIFASSRLNAVALGAACTVAGGATLSFTASTAWAETADQVGVTVPVASINASDKLDPDLHRLLDDLGHPVKAWVFFQDKGLGSAADEAAALAELASTWNERSIQRRTLRRSSPGLFDARDLPLAADYVQAVKSIAVATGGRVHVASRWLNAMSITGDAATFDAIAALPYVKRLQPVGQTVSRRPVNLQDGIRPDAMRMGLGESEVDGGGDPLVNPALLDYGRATDQLAQIGIIPAHDEGFKGDGVIIGILDTGFHREHQAFAHPDYPLQVLAEYDFINNDPNAGIESGDPDTQHHHGTLILGTIAAYDPGFLVGGAYEASFILCKTEDVSAEYRAEEDFYVAGLEFIEQQGGDVATSSLGYIDWYRQSDLNGQRAVTTIAVNAATDNGLICCTAAGNEGHDNNGSTSHLIAPADAFKVFTVGAATTTGEIASFSSDGPTADGRVKPEVLALGSRTWTVSPTRSDEYTVASGTSLSTPLIAAAVACMLDANPEFTVDGIREALLDTGSYYLQNGQFDPRYVYGYGLPNAYAALGYLNLISIAPGLAGRNNIIAISNCTPNSDVTVFYALNAGETAISGCPGVSLRLARPAEVSTGTADAEGFLFIETFVPQAARRFPVLLQAVEAGACRTSNVLTVNFL